MADRRPRSRHVDLEYTFDRLLARKLEQAYDILVPDRVRRTGEQTGLSGETDEGCRRLIALLADRQTASTGCEKALCSYWVVFLMITFTQGNLLEARADALVNTVNTVGVMGKGIALMFKERFAENFRRYAAACKAKEVRTGKMFVTEVNELDGPRWIVNFPTKQHWRGDSRMEWIVDGLQDLRYFLIENEVKSIAIPPLGAGNGGLDWADVRPQIVAALSDLDTEILVFEPTQKYQNVAKRTGVEKLTPARALIAELVRRYWVLGMECTRVPPDFVSRILRPIDIHLLQTREIEINIKLVCQTNEVQQHIRHFVTNGGLLALIQFALVSRGQPLKWLK